MIKLRKSSIYLGFKNMDLDFIWLLLTLIIIPAFIISPAFHSEVFVIYFILFILKTVRDGYRKCGLELAFFVAIAGIAISYIGVWDSNILKHTGRAARILCLPIIMSQYRFDRNLHRNLTVIFSFAAIYGITRMHLNPLLTGYAMDRPYCFMDFFMHSSVVASTGAVFCLISLIRAQEMQQKIYHATVFLGFSYLVLLHNVRGSYVSLAICLPCIVFFELKGSLFKKLSVVIAMFLALIAVTGIFQPELIKRTFMRLMSILDFSNDGNAGRIVIWQKAFEVFCKHPINGIGFSRLNFNNVDLGNKLHEWSFWHAHSEPLGILAETGLIGAVCWLIFKVRLFLLFFKRRQQITGALMMYLFIAFELHNMFEFYLKERTAYIYIYLLLGIGLNQLMDEHASKKSEQEAKHVL